MLIHSTLYCLHLLNRHPITIYGNITTVTQAVGDYKNDKQDMIDV